MARIGTNLYGSLFAIPCLLVMAVLLAYPMIDVIWLGFQERSIYELQGTFVGLDNFVRILKTPRFWQSLQRSMVWTFGGLAFQFTLGLGAALVCYPKFRGRMIMRGAVLLPYIVPQLVAVFLWKWMLNDMFGVVNYFIMAVGITDHPITWMSSPRYAMLGAIIISVWRWFPFVSVLLLARLETIPLDLFDAAKVDGASLWHQFRYVMLPALRSVAAIIILLRVIWNFGDWDLIYLATGGGPGRATETLPMYAYKVAFIEETFGLGAAVSVISFAALAIGSLAYIKFSKPV